MFVDEAKIFVKAGDGGSGCVSFRREKHVPRGGPDGGDGGNGGNVVLVVNPHMRTLLDFQYHNHFSASRGQHGKGKKMSGKSGADCIVFVPRGTVIRDAITNELLADLKSVDDRVVAAVAGRGGKGNARYVTATNQAPRDWEPGFPGEERLLQLELKLIADIGLVGFPNAGKSTLLSRITAAKPKIADYPFTTLSPNLGIVKYKDNKSLVVADIPGLIEGAHRGKGLGIKFLRHLERTQILVFMIEGTSNNIVKDYQTLLTEIHSYSPALAQKQKICAITKMDLVPGVINSGNIEAKLTIPVIPISAITGYGLAELLQIMVSTLNDTSGSIS